MSMPITRNYGLGTGAGFAMSSDGVHAFGIAQDRNVLVEQRPVSAFVVDVRIAHEAHADRLVAFHTHIEPSPRIDIL